MNKLCLKCGKEMNWIGRQKRRNYCSFVCSNSGRDFHSMGKKGGQHGLGKPKTGSGNRDIERLRQIGRIGGINSAKKQPERSKGEIFLSNLLKENGYNIVESKWDLVDGYEIDIFIPTLNIAISYNGEVHRKPIYGEIRLLQVLRRDVYRNRKLSEMGIKHIVVEDEDEGRFNEEKVKKQYEWCIEEIKKTQVKNIVY